MILLLQSKGEGREKANATRGAGPRGHPLVAGVFPGPHNPTGGKDPHRALRRRRYRFRGAALALARVSSEMGVPRKPNRRRSWLTR